MFKRIIVMAVVLFWFKAAFGAHPLITDDTGTQGAGGLQLEINGEYGHEDEDGVTEAASEIAAIFSCGIADNVDIVFGVPYQYIRTEDDGEDIDEDGISDTSMEVKWRFFEEGAVGLALKPGITLPTGDEGKGLGAGRAIYSLFFIATRETGSMMFHLNLGYARNDNKADERKDIWHVSLASEIEAAKNLRAVANIGTERNADKESNTHPAFVLAGLIYSLTENFDIDLGVKGGLNKPETDYSILAGTALRF